MNKKMTTEKNAQRVATGKSTPRTRKHNWGYISFVVFSVVVFATFVKSGHGQSTNSNWPIFRSDARLSARAQVDGPSIPDLYWVKAIGSEKIQSPVVTSEGTIIFTSRGDNFVFALNPDNSIKWRFSHVFPGSNNNETFSAPPALGADGTVYVGSHEGGFFAINPNGSLKWRAAVGGYVGTAPNLDKDGNIYIAVDDAQLHVFDPAGNLLCIGSLDGLKPINTPTITANGTAYVPAGNSIFVFNSSCTRLARWVLPSLGEVAWVVGNASGSVLYAGSVTNPLVLALDAQTGRQLWRYSYDSSSGPPSPAAIGPDGSIHFAGINAGVLITLTPNGNEKWKFNVGSSRYKTMPVVDLSGNVYIVNESSDFGLFKLSSSGNELWRMPNVQCDYSIAIGPDGTLYIPSLKKIYAVRHQPPYADSLALFDGDGQTGCIDSVLANAIRARVFDQYGNPFPGQPVHFRAIVGGGSPLDTTVFSGPDGIAQIDWQLGSLLGEQKLEISSARNGTPLKGSPITISAIAHGPAIDGEKEVGFDITAVNDSSQRTYTIKNISDCILTIDRLELADSTHFSIKPPSISNVPISPGGQLVVTLVFAPSVADSLVDTLLVFSNDPAQPRFAVVLRGEAIAQPEIVVHPLSFEFGEVMVGSDSTQSITISNVGSATLVVSNFDFSDSAYTIDLTPPVSVPAGGSVPGKITFAPTEGRPYPDTLEIVSNDPKNDTVAVALNGSGKRMPKISVQPDTLAFGKVCVDSCLTLPVTISNAGNDTLVVDSLATIDNTIFKVEPGEFRILPGESVKVLVAFCPKEAKSYAGTLSIFSNDPAHSVHVVELFGEGISPKIVLDPIPPVLEVCAGELVTGVVNVINDSDCDLRIDSVKFAIVTKGLVSLQGSGGHWQTAATGFIIHPHESAPLSYSFPAPAVNFEVRFRVRSNGMPDPAEITIPGKIKPPVIAAVDTVNFGDVPVGETKLDHAKVWSEQCKVIVVSDTITGSEAFAFHREPFAFPDTLSEGEIANLPVTFNPKDIGVHTAFLEVFSNDPQRNPIKIVLIGNGVLKQPDIEVSPMAVDFGTTCAEDSVVVKVFNRGDTTLHVTDLNFSNPAFFTTHSTSFSVASKDSEAIVVHFTPTVAQTDTGSLLIFSDDPDEKIVVVKLSGTGGEPDIAGAREVTFEPMKVQICSGQPGDTTSIYWIKNDGTCDLEITSLLTAAPFEVSAPATPQIIKPGDSLAVTLTFAPSDSGVFNGTLHIVSNDPDENPFEVALRGLGVSEPEIEVQPVVVDFDTVCAIDSSLVKVFNRGHNTLRVTNLVFSGTAFLTTHATNFTVAPCDSEMIWVYFTPTPGQPDSGSLAIHSDDRDEPAVTVELKGEGGKPEIAGAPSPVEFPVVNIRECATGEQDSSEATFVLRNLGVCDLVISSFRVDGDFSIKPTSLPITISPNGSINLTLYFKPKAQGDFTGALHVFSNDPDTPDFVVPLNGKATADPQIATQPPDTLRFFGVRVDSSSEKFIVVSNIGSDILRVTNISITGTVFTTTTPTPFELTCDSTKSVNVIFTPTDDILYVDTLTFVSNDPATPNKDVILIGNGTPPPPGCIKVVPTAINFGTVCDEDSMMVVVSDTCAGDLKVTNLVFTNPAFWTTHADSFTILPGRSDTIWVRFNPTFAKSDSGSLLIYSDDPNPNRSVVRVKLEGKGGAPRIGGANPPPFNDVEVQTCSGMDNKGVMLYKLFNTGTCSLTVQSFSVNAPFSVATAPPKIPPQGSSDIVLVFEPKANRTFTEVLSITSDDPIRPVFQVTLEGTGVFKPDIEVTPNTLQYNAVSVGDSATRFIKIANHGAENLVVSNFIFSDPVNFFIPPPVPSPNLACTESIYVAVVFSPTRGEAYSETLTIVSNDPNESSVEVKLLGNGDVSKPEISLEPQPLQFPDVCLGTDTTLCLTVENIGTADLDVSEWHIVPADSIFTSEVHEFTLGPNLQNSDSVCVTFSPKDALEYRAFLIITHNAPSSPDTVLLIGRGVSPNIAGADSLLFPNTGVGRSDTLSYTVLGDTFCTLHVDSLTFAGADTSDFKIVGISMKPDTSIASFDSLKFDVEFKPTALGMRMAQLKIWSNDKGKNPFVVHLQGNGVPGQLAVIPNPLEVRAACIGETKIIAGRLENKGPGNLRIYPPLRLASEESGNDGYHSFKLIAPKLERDTLLTPGQSLEIVIEFTAIEAGTFTDELLVRLESPNATPQSFSMLGEARQKGAIISVWPEVVNFAGKLNKEVPRDVTIKNMGCEPLTIQKLEMAAGQQFFRLIVDPSVVTLQPNDSVSATVSFRGRIFDKDYNGELLIYSNDTEKNSPESVSLTARLENGETLCLTLPDTLKFGEVPVGNEPSLPLEITNCDKDEETVVTIKALELEKEKAAFVVSLNDEVDLQPDIPYSVSVQFKPNASRLYIDKLRIEVWPMGKSDAKTTKEVVLMGTGTGVDDVILKPNFVTPNGDDKNEVAIWQFPKELQNPVLRIFDLRGLRVVVLEEKNNTNTIEWEGKDESGRIVLPGAYIWILDDQGRRVKSGQVAVIR